MCNMTTYTMEMATEDGLMDGNFVLIFGFRGISQYAARCMMRHSNDQGLSWPVSAVTDPQALARASAKAAFQDNARIHRSPATRSNIFVSSAEPT